MFEITFTPRKPIAKTVIVGTDSRKSAGSGISRGIIGGSLFGPIGAIGGALSAKNKNRTVFLIIYKDNTRETLTVANDSLEYKEYIKYLEI